jgi:hypothetical protein
MIRGNSRTFASSDAAPKRHLWGLAALLLYGLAAAGDFAYHLVEYRHTGDQKIEASEVAVAYAAALFWPLDVAAMALLPR